MAGQACVHTQTVLSPKTVVVPVSPLKIPVEPAKFNIIPRIVDYAPQNVLCNPI